MDQILPEQNSGKWWAPDSGTEHKALQDWHFSDFTR